MGPRDSTNKCEKAPGERSQRRFQALQEKLLQIVTR